jgi:hypothetical protein
MSNSGTKLNNQPIVAQMSTTTDYHIITVGGVTARINNTNLAAELSPLISDSVLKSTVRTVSASTGILVTDNVVLADSSSGNISLTLPAPTNAFDTTTNRSNSFTISQKIHGGNTVTILPNGSESIFDGVAQPSIVLSTGTSVTVVTDGTNWAIVSA